MRTQIFSAKPICLGLFAVLAAAAHIRAEDTPMALGLLMANPQGDLNDRSGTGFGASLSLEWHLKKKHAFRGTLEYAKFSDKTYYHLPHDPGVATEEYPGSANVQFAMLDYIYRFVSHDKGLYLAFGAGYGNSSVKPDTDWEGYSISGLGLCFSAGVGYNLAKNFGLEISQIVTSTYNPEGSGARLYNWSQVALKYRFLLLD